MEFYLAGPFASYQNLEKIYSDWRDYVKEKVSRHDWFDPRFDSNQLAIMDFTQNDIEGASRSDGVFAYNPNGNTDLGGMVGECVAAYKSEKPTILVDEERGFQYPFLHGVAKRIFGSIDAGILYLNNLESFDNEFPAIYATMKFLKK